MNRPLAAVGAIAGAALVLSGLQVAGAGSAGANPAGTGLVISEVFTSAANGVAPYDADFIELYNPTSAAIGLSGKSLQLRQADDTVIGTVPLSTSVPAGHHFLVQVDAASSPSTGHQDLPTPDLVADPALAASAVNQTAEVILGDASGSAPDYGTGNLASKAHVIDMVGFAGAGSYEAASADLPAGVSQVYNSVHRADNAIDAGADTDNNATDFTWAGPTPENATSSLTSRVAPTLAPDTTTYLGFMAPGHTAWPTSSGVAIVIVHASGASGAPTPTGVVQISGPAGYATDDAALQSGTAYGQYDTTGLAPGTYQLTLSYNGDANYAPASMTFSLTVEAGGTVSKVTAPDASVTANQDLSEQVAVASVTSGGATPTGVVTIWSGKTLLSKSFGTTLASGAASVTVPFAKLAPGTSTLTAKYSGDDTYAQSSSTFTVKVPKLDSPVTVSAPATTYGAVGQVKVKLAATSVAAAGNVTLTGAGPAQTKPVGTDGSVTFALPATLSAGSYALTASYLGDGAHNAATGHATLVVAKKAPGAIHFKAKKFVRMVKAKAKVKVAGVAGVAGPSGKVALRLTKGKKHKSAHGTLVEGVAKVKLPKLPKKGKWKVTVSYGGDANYAAAPTKTFKVKVK